MRRFSWSTLAFQFLVSGMALCQQYFPDHAFDPRDNINNFSVYWYRSQLKALDEPSLWKLSKQSSRERVYRFLWLRSFHHPIVVRLNLNPDGSGTVTTKIASGAGGYDPGKLIVNRTRGLGTDDVKRFLSRVDKERYWDLPTKEQQTGNVIGVDGAQWVIEAVRIGNYKIVDRWSPSKGPIKDLGLTMLRDLAQLKLPDQEIY